MTRVLALIGRPAPRLRHALRIAALTLVVCAGPAATRAWAQPGEPLSVPAPGTAATARIPILKNVGIDQKMGAQVPLDIPFVDEDGHDVKLGDYFGKGPVVLALVYYQCPMLCTLVMNGVTEAIEPLTLTAGKDFQVVAVSFDPSETPMLAAGKKKMYLDRYRRPGAENGMHFLTGRQESIQRLTSAVGFKYVYDPEIGQFAHPSAITVLTSTGAVSRYLFGIDYGRDLKLALVDAGDGKVGTVVDQALLFCYHYDPMTGKYGLVILNVVRIGGVLTVGILGALILMTVRRDRRQGAAADAKHPASTGVR